jgi:hypothetical protein
MRCLYAKKLFVVYLKFKFDQVFCILPGNTTQEPENIGIHSEKIFLFILPTPQGNSFSNSPVFHIEMQVMPIALNKIITAGEDSYCEAVSEE